MTEGQCINVVIHDPSIVVRACHESLGLLHHADSETVIVDSFESAIDDCISLLTLCLEYTLV